MKKKVMVVLLLASVILSGCWDRDEIEEIGFLLAVGLDPMDKEEQQQYFKTTYQLAVPAKIKSEEGPGGGEAFTNITTTGMTNFNMSRQFSTRSSRVINLEHLQVIIIHQKLARQGIMEHLIDYFIRDHQMRRRTRVFITGADSKAILDGEHPLEDTTAQTILHISDNHPRVLAMIEPVDIGTLSEFVIGQRSYVVPRIVHHGQNDIKIAQAAVFLGKTNKMLGWLGEEETGAYNWIMEAAEMGAIEVPYENGQTFVYENFDQATVVKYERKNGQDEFHIEIRTEGTFAENWIKNIEINDLATLKKLEEAIAERIEEQTTKLIDKMQNEFHADIFEFYKYVRQKDYPHWKEVEESWDGKNGAFSRAKVHVKVKAKIRHYMLNEKLED